MRGAPLVFLFAAACVSHDRVEPVVRPIVGPDGSPMLHVSCGQNEARCYELAGQSCPGGYDVAPTPQHNWLVRCREPAPAPTVTVMSRPAVASANSQTLAPSPYAIPETVQPWPADTLAPSPYPPLAPGRAQPSATPEAPPPRHRDLGF